MLNRVRINDIQTFDDGSTLTLFGDGSRLTVSETGQVIGLDGNTSNNSDAYRMAVANYGYRGPLNTGATNVNPDQLPYGMDIATADALESFAPNVVQKIAESQTPGESWVDTAQKIFSALVMSEQQRQLMQLNIERAKQGLPPIDISRYSGVGVNVGLSAGTQQLVTYALLAGGALILLNTLMSRR